MSDGGPPAAKRKVTFELVQMDALPVQAIGRYLVKGVLPRSGLVVAWGPPKSGKSFWGTDLALHVAMGKEYRGLRTLQGTVCYVCAEGTSGIGARLQAWRSRNLSEEATGAPFYVLPGRVDLIAQSQILISDIKVQIPAKPALVVIDTLNRTFTGSESNDQDMSAYVKAADAITAAFDCCTLIIHHCGIDGTRPRGHTSLTGAADAQIAIKRDAAGGTINSKVEWMKDGPEIFDANSRLEILEVGIDEDGEPVTSCVIVPTDEEPSQREKKTFRLTTSQTLALQALNEAITEAGSAHLVSSHVPASARTVPTELWRKYLYSRTSEKEPSARQKAFKRAVESLQSKGIIQIWEDAVWIVNSSEPSSL